MRGPEVGRDREGGGEGERTQKREALNFQQRLALALGMQTRKKGSFLETPKKGSFQVTSTLGLGRAAISFFFFVVQACH